MRRARRGMWLDVDGARVHVLATARPSPADVEALRAGVAEVRRRATMKAERHGPTTNTDTLRLCRSCGVRATFQAGSLCSDCRAGGAAWALQAKGLYP